jgi:LPXTG-site transpeptidase (sortase) family protein
MIEKIRKLPVKSLWLVLPGVVMVFLGAMGVTQLFASLRSASEMATMEIPRDMIESGYTSFEDNVPTEGGFVPYSLPVGGTPSFLPTMPAGDGLTLSEGLAQEIAMAPTVDVAPTQSQQIPDAAGDIPEWIYLPSMKIMAPIVPATSEEVVVTAADGTEVTLVEWLAPDEYAAGWQTDSARLGVPGNTVLNGHHNVYERVFGHIVYLVEGDLIQVYGGGKWYNYIVTNKMVLPERDVPLEKRLENAAWIMPSQDERLTLVTCWPEQNNTHRLIIVARPLRPDEIITPTPTP